MARSGGSVLDLQAGLGKGQQGCRGVLEPQSPESPLEESCVSLDPAQLSIPTTFTHWLGAARGRSGLSARVEVALRAQQLWPLDEYGPCG